MEKQLKLNVWEGVYRNFAEAPVQGPGFDGETWRSRSLAAAHESLDGQRAGRPLDYSMRMRNSALVVLVATLLKDKPRIRILDFGGGPGYGYLVLLAAIPDAARRIDYHVVEVETVCREGRAIFGDDGPNFRTDLPKGESFDIVFTASTLQYIEDWQAICALLAGYGAPYLLFADVFAGPLEAYVTLQTYYESRIAHWLLNDSEFVAAVQGNGYKLLMQSDCNVKVLGRHGPLPMDNLPPERRLANTHHFLFGHEG